MTTRDLYGQTIAMPGDYGVTAPYYCKHQASGECPLRGLSYESIQAHDDNELHNEDIGYCLNMASAIAHGKFDFGDRTIPLEIHVCRYPDGKDVCSITHGRHRLCISSHLAALGHDPAYPINRIVTSSTQKGALKYQRPLIYGSQMYREGVAQKLRRAFGRRGR